MSPSRARLIAFALVAVLCVCMVTGVSGSTEQNSDVLTTSTTAQGSGQGNDDNDTKDTTSPHQESSANSVTSSDAPPSQRTKDTSKESLSISTHSDVTLQQDPSPGTTPTTESTATLPHVPPSSTATCSTAITPGHGGPISGGNKNEAEGAKSGGGNIGAGIFFLILVLVIIIILVVITYILWKKGKRYSFDLTNSEHETLQVDQPGTFEQSKGSTMNLEYIQEDNPDKSGPVANGCSGETPGSGETPCPELQSAPEEDSFTSDLSLNSPVKKVEFNLDLELLGGEPEPAKQATDEPTDNDNENNNNDTSTGDDSPDLFTEINLDDAQ